MRPRADMFSRARLAALALALAAPALAPSAAVNAQQPAPPAAPAPAVADPLGTAAPFAYILDADTGATLYSKRGEEPLIPASMTKLMTYYIVFERLRDGRLSLDDELLVSEEAWRRGGAASGGSTMFLRLGSRVRVEDLLRGAIVQSGNDACIVLAEGVAGSEAAFAALMTERAAELGLSASTFRNATGLDEPGHRMSARDIARLADLLIDEFPQFYPIFSEPSFTWNGITQPNRNPLLRGVEGADGLKTGHLAASGYGLVGSAVRDGKRRIVVLQGLSSEAERAREAERVMRAAFADFLTVDVVKPGAEVGEAEVWLGRQPLVPLVVEGGLQLGLHADAADRLEAIVVYQGPLRAPVSAGDPVGELVVTAPGLAPVRAPVVAGADVERLGLFGRALAGLRGP